ncbi:MAG: GNAT family N-acetyltransferase [Cryobacterium sp.]|nr:GNAT family N-acetyltransferase [Cryobacterium sp.]
MQNVTTEVATPDRWDDAQHALTGGGDGKSCQCGWWTLTNAEWSATSVDDRRDRLQGEIDSGPPPGIIAYVDGEAAGWVRVGPRTAQARISRTRNIATATVEPFDDPHVWAVSCFVVRREHRGIGVTSALLDAAVAYARSSGARLVEAYPIDTAGTKHSTNELFLGTLTTFLAAGFTEVALRKPGRPLVALELNP